MFRTTDITPGDHAYLALLRATLEADSESDADEAVAYAESLLRHGFPVVFDVAHVAFATGVSARTLGAIRAHPERFYRFFALRKSDGGSRQIAVPTPALRTVQDWLLRHVVTGFVPHDACHGFVKKRSIITNAQGHTGQRAVVRFDVRDFFGSVKRAQVYRLFRRVGYSVAVANLFADFTTYRDSLPQGAPTSPCLANMAAERLDHRLSRFAARNGLHFTRYADDLAFSGPTADTRKVKRTVELIMRSEGFAANDGKTRFMNQHQRQIVAGIVVNDRPNWPRSRRRWLRQEIHYLQEYGLHDHLSRRGTSPVAYKARVYGHVYALKQLCPKEAQTYLRVLDTLDWPY